VLHVLAQCGPTRDQLIAQLDSMGVGTSVHFIPVHQLSHFRTTLPLEGRSFAGAERAAGEILSLPIYPRMTDTDVDTVCGTIEAALDSRAVMS
jgi:dTDP-4-amino-4,6-dideoxygalactose transaminase